MGIPKQYNQLTATDTVNEEIITERIYLKL